MAVRGGSAAAPDPELLGRPSAEGPSEESEEHDVRTANREATTTATTAVDGIPLRIMIAIEPLPPPPGRVRHETSPGTFATTQQVDRVRQRPALALPTGWRHTDDRCSALQIHHGPVRWRPVLLVVPEYERRLALLQFALLARREARVKLLEAGCRDLSLSGAVPPGQQPGSTCAQKQLVSEGHGGQHDDQSGQGHEDGESHAPSIRGEDTRTRGLRQPSSPARALLARLGVRLDGSKELSHRPGLCASTPSRGRQSSRLLATTLPDPQGQEIRNAEGRAHAEKAILAFTTLRLPGAP